MKKIKKQDLVIPDVETLWEQGEIAVFQKDFLEWYQDTRRDLPWRESNDPYRIWVSEIMLQQTQVVTVIPYFHRFLDWFPTIQALAEADEERLLKAWEGLGYYSRVRNMQKAAQQIVADFNGEMPQTIDEISQLKGIGPYTAGAIGSIAFNLPEPAIDGNVMRVFSRLFELEADIAKPSSRKVFDSVVRQVMPHHDPSSFNQAIMDLGATVCTPKAPLCESCPLQKHCLSQQKGTMLSFPVKSKKVKSRPVYYVAQVIKNEEGQYLLEQRPSEGLLANLWTFPLVEVSKEVYEKTARLETVQDGQVELDLVAEAPANYHHLLKENSELPVIWQTKRVGEITHVFSHLKWFVSVAYGHAKKSEIPCDQPMRWVTPSEFEDYPFPKPQQKMVELLEGNRYLELSE